MRPTPALLTIALTASLAACGPDPTPAPLPELTWDAPSPVSETEEEALAAAEEAIRRYLEISDAVDSPRDLELLRPLSTESWFEFERSSREDLWSRGIHTEGSTSLRFVKLQFFDESEIAVYVCQETSGTRLIDGSGIDVTGSERSPEALLQINLEMHEGKLLVAGGELWSNSYS